MPIDWDEAEKQIDEALDAARKRTNDKLAATISSLTRLTDAEVKKLFPTPADVEQLATLMKVVKSADDRNKKLNQIIKNVESMAGAILTIVDRFA
ncbi:MAG: hypothetical protein IT347_11670 [Candidatus Eisenbacteria bacterium]|nr:hypothetical protein [Candidatus Eisenbacteria bacterium]